MAAQPLIEAEFGPHFPRRGNAFSRLIGRLLLRLVGFRIVGSPPDVPKLIVVAAPHTSNWDGILLLIAMLAANLDLRWVGKHTLFKGMTGGLLRWAGGVPVHRGRSGGFIDEVVQRFAEHEHLALVIAPEGTRGATADWKSGFHRIARDAGVPIVAGYIDYARKTIGFGPGLSASGDFADYLAQLRDFLADVTPRHPQRFTLPRAQVSKTTDGDAQ